MCYDFHIAPTHDGYSLTARIKIAQKDPPSIWIKVPGRPTNRAWKGRARGRAAGRVVQWKLTLGATLAAVWKEDPESSESLDLREAEILGENKDQGDHGTVHGGHSRPPQS